MTKTLLIKILVAPELIRAYIERVWKVFVVLRVIGRY